MSSQTFLEAMGEFLPFVQSHHEVSRKSFHLKRMCRELLNLLSYTSSILFSTPVLFLLLHLQTESYPP